MSKWASRINLTLPDSLRIEVKKAAKEAHLTESAFIREAIKSRLRNPPEDPFYWLQPEKETQEMSAAGHLLLILVAGIYAYEEKRATADEKKVADERANRIISGFWEREKKKNNS